MKKSPNKISSKKNIDLKIERQALLDRFFLMEYVLVVLIIGIFFLLRKNFVGIPMERDEGSYVMYGKWLIDGGKPYLDFYEMKPPGIFLVYGFMVKFFGYDYMNLQTGFCYLNSLTLLFSYLFFKKIFERNTAMAILPVYGFLLLNPYICGFTIQAEFVVLFFVMLGMLILFEGKKRSNSLLIMFSGICLGFSILIKQNGIFYCLFGGLFFLIEWWNNRKTRKLIFEFSSYIVGILVPFAFIFFWLNSQGLIQDTLFWIVEFPRKYYLNSSLSFGDVLKTLTGWSKGIINTHPLFWFIALVGIVCGFFLKNLKEKKLLAYTFIFFSALTIFPGLRFYNHYWILFMPGIAISICFAYHFLQQITSKIKLLKQLTTILFFVIPIAHFGSSFSYYLHPDFTEILHQVYSNEPFPEAKVVGEYLKSIMKPEDKLFVAGTEPEIYLYTNTLGVTRHNGVYIISLKYPFAQKMRQEAIRNIETNTPRFIVIVNNPFSWMFESEIDNTFYNWIQKYAAEKYKIILLANQINQVGDCDYILEKDIPNYKGKGSQFITVWELK